MHSALDATHVQGSLSRADLHDLTLKSGIRVVDRVRRGAEQRYNPSFNPPESVKVEHPVGLLIALYGFLILE